VAEVGRTSLVLSNAGGICPRGYLAEVVVAAGEAGLTQASQPLDKGRAAYQVGCHRDTDLGSMFKTWHGCLAEWCVAVECRNSFLLPGPARGRPTLSWHHPHALMSAPLWVTAWKSRSQIGTLCFSRLYPARTSSDGTGSSEKKAGTYLCSFRLEVRTRRERLRWQLEGTSRSRPRVGCLPRNPGAVSLALAHDLARTRRTRQGRGPACAAF
jgi:hypothetical protein